jgi:hypothetical protein
MSDSLRLFAVDCITENNDRKRWGNMVDCGAVEKLPRISFAIIDVGRSKAVCAKSKRKLNFAVFAQWSIP